MIRRLRERVFYAAEHEALFKIRSVLPGGSSGGGIPGCPACRPPPDINLRVSQPAERGRGGMDSGNIAICNSKKE
jgi:hypothetical protein